MKLRCISLLSMTLALSACGNPAVKPCARIPEGDVVYVVGQGWHAEIGIPVEELGDDLAFYRDVFSDARVIMFGYGKKTFYTAPPETLSEYVLGPVPGPAAIHAVGLRVMPPQAYPAESTVMLALPPGGAEALSEFIWKDLSKNKAGKPRVVARSSNPDGLFYQAQSRYSLMHTCNSWTADALDAAGLPISGEGIVFSSQVMTRVGNAAKGQCRSLFRN
jgi:hypothetical protein